MPRRRNRWAGLLALLLWGWGMPLAEAAPAPTPSSGPARSIGSAANGCLAGAQAMPLDGPGWQILRPSRNRFWGHPRLLQFLRDIAARTAPLGTLLIGDLSQPRGGRMTSGHASHQTGIDVDVFFRLGDAPLSGAEREQPDLPSMLRPDGSLDPARWSARQVAMLSRFAEDSRVERIFVNPHIKRALCRTLPPDDRAWLHEIRPWYGHDDHFHVRLSCPADSPDCRPAPAIPAGDGCGADLDWWFSDEALHPKPHPPAPPPVPPAACRAVWAE